MVNKPKIKGTMWETAITKYLRSIGVSTVERRALHGSQDRGDIAGIPGIVIEAKSAARLDLSGWLDEAEQERRRDGAGIGVVWAKRRGRTSAGNGYVIMDGLTFTKLLADGGHIPPLVHLEQVEGSPPP